MTSRQDRRRQMAEYGPRATTRYRRRGVVEIPLARYQDEPKEKEKGQ